MAMNLYDQLVHQLCKQYVRSEDVVFDCGCGDGAKSKIVRQYTDHVVAGDLDNRAKELGDIPFVLIKPDSYGDENRYDVVTSFDVIEHVENDEGFLRQIVRILKPGGTAIIGTPNRERFSNKIYSIIKGRITYPRTLGYHYESGGAIIHLREYTANDLLTLAAKVPAIVSASIHRSFLGLYTPLGPVGLKRLDCRFGKDHVQHLFLVVRKGKEGQEKDR